jgi:hypothetical protein
LPVVDLQRTKGLENEKGQQPGPYVWCTRRPSDNGSRSAGTDSL